MNLGSKDPFQDESKQSNTQTEDPLTLIDQLLAKTPQDDRRHPLLYRLRENLLEEELGRDKVEGEINRLNQVVEKVTTPANRLGTLLALTSSNLAHIVVGGADYYANIDPRINKETLKIGSQVLVNDAFAVIESINDDGDGPVVKISALLSDGRLRVGQEQGAQSILLLRSSRLKEAVLKVGEEVRLDPSRRIAIEKIEQDKKDSHVLEETPTVRWDEIGGQKKAIKTIRERIEHPLLYPDLYKKYDFSQPKGFLLYGPPGCGKTLIGKATAQSLSEQMKAKAYFIHLKGPEILNMWLGESERMVREIFTRAREKRKEGHLPFIFIDEAESILGTRRSGRSHSILNTLVPMFCAEMDGIESLQETVIILASNRPDLIDPAILRPGRIDRKIKINRPDREATLEILGIYLKDSLPLSPDLLQEHKGDQQQARQALLEAATDALFSKSSREKVLNLHLRSGRERLLYRSDLLTGALLASIVQRAKERAIKRAAPNADEGLSVEDLCLSIDAEFKEGEILPPNDISDDWLTLLDVDPENVVGLSLVSKQEKASNGKKVI